jgi:hypothetical protein
MPRERPEPLPPETRTVGQLVAETVRLYGDRFWLSLLLGVGPAASGLVLATLGRTAAYVWPFTVGALANAISYYGAVLVAHRRPVDTGEARAAIAVGFLVFVPFSLLAALFLLPAAAWLGLVGLAVPAAVLERVGARDAFRRGIALARADYIHAFGAFAALLVVIVATTFALFFLLRGQGDAARAVAGFLSVLVISPLLFLGGALLYLDQVARAVDSRAQTRPRRRSDADVHHADDAHRAGRPDAQVEPGAPARGEP